MILEYFLYKALKKKKNNSINSQSLGNKSGISAENKPFQNSKCPLFGSCDINYIEADEIPENSNPTINKSIQDTDVKNKTSGLFGTKTTSETGEGSLKESGLSTATIVGVAGAGVLLVVLLTVLGSKK